jgi:thioredoxin-like negative regulator of GroEL
MRGLKVGGWLLGVAIASLMIPFRAQGATAEQYIAAGQQLYTAKDYNKALQYYSAAVKLNPNNGPAYQGIGNCLYGLGRKADALAYYRRASALQPGNAQLAQFVQSLSAQVAAGGTSAPAGGMGGDALGQGMAFFQQKQYAASIPYFLQAIQQNPNNDKAYYYAGYSYYMTRDAKNAALYFGVANAKSPNASVKAYADRIKSSLPAEDQQWVDDQVSRYSSGAVAGTRTGGKSDMAFGFRILGGTEYVLSDPAQIKDYVTAAGSVSLNGVTPNLIPLVELEPFVQIADSFEINLACSYFPIGNLSYDWVPYGVVTLNDGTSTTPMEGYRYSYNTTLVSGGAGVKLLFGEKGVKGYLGLGGDVTPVSMTFSKVKVDYTDGSTMGIDPSSGDYTTLAIGGHARLGVDFSLGKSISFGPYIGFKYLTATNFKNAAGTLVVNTENGDVGNSGLAVVSTTKPLEMDFSGINAGIDLTFAF